MKLLVSQKDELYDLIERFGLSPSMFEFSELPSQISAGQRTTLLKLKNSEFFYSFETNYRTEESHYAIYSPGNGSIKETQIPGSWDLQKQYFKYWLQYLSREINAPNKWERLSKEISNLGIYITDDESKFTAFEFEDLKKRMLLLKDSINSIGLDPEQLNLILDKLDHLLNLSKNMSKFDWKALFLGTIVSIIIQLSLSPDVGKLLWDMIKQVFNNFILP
jgi:hypothetical protein